MPIVVVCPSCNARLKAPDTAAGKAVRCPHCSTPVRATAAPPAEPAATAPAPDRPGKRQAPPSDAPAAPARRGPRVSLDRFPEDAREWVEGALARGEAVVHAGSSSTRIAFMEQVPTLLFVAGCLLFVILLTWLVGTIPTELLPVMAPVILGCGMIFGVLWTAQSLMGRVPRHHFVTDRRVLMYQRGGQSGEYSPDEMRDMTFTRALLAPGGGRIIFSATTEYRGERSTTRIKGLLDVERVAEAARAIHDHILAAGEDDGERERSFRPRDRTARRMLRNGLLLGGLLVALFVPTLIAVPYLAAPKKKEPGPAKELAGLDRTIAELEGKQASAETLRALAKGPVVANRQAEVARALGPLVRSGDAQVAQEAMAALGAWGTAESVPLAHEVLASRPKGDRMRLSAIDLFSHQGKEKEVAVMIGLTEEGGYMTYRCARALIRLGKREEVEKFRTHRRPEVRDRAAQALEQQT